MRLIADTTARVLPRGIRLRRGTLDDEFAAFETMRRAMGYEMSWANHAPMRHHLRQSPDASFWVAEEMPRFSRPKVIGYARSIVRERVWSLTEFFLQPEHQRRGVGGALLARCLDDGAEAGADTRLVLASQNSAADSLYIRKAGCTPRLPMLMLAGTLDRLRVRESEAETIIETAAPHREWRRENLFAQTDTGVFGTDAALHAEPILLTANLQNELTELDRCIVGYARPEEHRHWMAAMGGLGGSSRLFREGGTGRLVGYAYLGSHCGCPALAVDPALLPRMIAHVAGISRSRVREETLHGFIFSSEHYMALSGSNETVLRWLLECGWQIVFQYLFMASRPLGQFDRYVCHNPLYVL